MDCLSNILLICVATLQILLVATYPTIDQYIAAARDTSCEINPQCIEFPGFQLKELDMLIAQPQNRRRKKRKGLISEIYRWTDGIVPYAIRTSDFQASQINVIRQAMDYWSTHTCLQFVERTTESAYIDIFSGNGCYSYVGRQQSSRQPQELSIGPGCNFDYIVEHELAHALGLIHEQTRPDRDGFVNILTQNIISGQEHNFDKWSLTHIGYFDTLYDFLSVMHYGPYGFTKNQQRTITTKDPDYMDLIGASQEPSFTDVKILNNMYQCAAQAGCSGSCTQPRAFMNKHCQCLCPGSDPIYATQSIVPCPNVPPTDGTSTTTDGNTPTTGSTASTESASTTTTVSTTTTEATTPSTANPPRNCFDWFIECFVYAYFGYCQGSPAVMGTYCPRSCRMC